MSEAIEWSYNETSEFIHSFEELKVREEVRCLIKDWAVSFNRQITPRSKRYFCSPNNIFEIWIVRVPDPDSNKGTRSGFRLALFLNFPEKSINICKMKRRDELDKPNEKNQQGDYLRELKSFLMAKLDKLEIKES